ncbi:MAG: NAD-dependent epimerase/dehydratase family protein [Desulfobacterales bacterium]|nr:NAD-dependent epimerase/dehydratase family protein [Desulfobacterales bacterium]
MRHCCVIGGTGFIGSHVVNKLSLRQMQVTVIGRKPIPTRALPKTVRYAAGNFGDKHFLLDALRGVDEIVHLGYLTVPKTSYDDPVKDILNNLPAMVILLETAILAGVKKFVFVSTGGAIYGKCREIPIKEDHPTQPISPYGISKLTTEKYAEMFSQIKSLPVICIRPANAYGEGQKPNEEQGFIINAIAAILRRQSITVFGKTGTVRDYIHVDDVAEGIIAASTSGKLNSCYNIGSGVGRNNNDILAALYPFAKSVGLEPKVKRLPLRPFDVPFNVLDSTKLIEETGWKSQISFEEGIRRTWDWCYQKHKKGEL